MPKHAIIKKKDGSTVNLCTGDKTEAPAVEASAKTAPTDQPREMDAMERALSSQIDKFVDLIERGVDEHGAELTPEGVAKIKNDMKVIEGAIQDHRARK